jgi:hypothetical protein
MPRPILIRLNTDTITSAPFNAIVYDAGKRYVFAYATDGKIIRISNADDTLITNYRAVTMSCGGNAQVNDAIINPYTEWNYRGIFTFGQNGFGSHASFSNNNTPLTNVTCFATGTLRRINAATSIGGNPSATYVPLNIVYVTDSGYVHSTKKGFLVPAGIKASSGLQFCKGLGSVTLTDTAWGSNYDYQWYRNQVKINGATNKTITITDSGTYRLKRSILSGVGYQVGQPISKLFSLDTNSNSLNVSFLPAPERPVIAIQAPDTLSAPTASASKYVWLLGRTVLSDTASKLRALATGSYRVIAYNAIGCKSDTSLPFSYIRCADINRALNYRNDTTICVGSNLVFRYVVNQGFTGAAYQWFKNGNPIASATTNNLQSVADSGTYALRVTLANCTLFSDTIKVNVSALPTTPIITPSGTSDLCSGDSVVLTGPLGFSRYVWVNATNQTVKDTTSNRFVLRSALTGLRLKVKNVAGCQSASSAAINIMATVKPTRPTMVVTGNSITAVLNPAVANATYKWFKNGVLVSGTTGATLNNAEDGASYTCVAFVRTCVSDTSTPILVVGLQKLQSDNFKIYPNPNNGSFKVRVDLWAIGGTLSVTDLAGKEIFATSIETSEAEIAMSDMAKGLFIVQYTKGTTRISKKLLVQ